MRHVLGTVMIVALTLAQPVGLHAQEPTERQQLESLLEQLEATTARLRSILFPPMPVPTSQTIDVPCGASLQTAIAAARSADLDTTLRIVPSPCIYVGPFRVEPNPHGKRITITTGGWDKPGERWAGTVRPEDKPRLGILQGADRTPVAIEIPPGSDHVRLVGVLARCAHVDCTVIRIGDTTLADPARLPKDIEIRQVLVEGSRTWGTRSGIRADGDGVTIAQAWCEEVWKDGQDSWCVGLHNGGRNVVVEDNYLSAGSENVIVGGGPPASAAMHPRNIIIRRNLLHKPRRWQTDGQRRQVKNGGEVKFGTNIVFEDNAFVNTWVAGQDGKMIVLHATTNGNCPHCGNAEDIIVRRNVVLNARIAIGLQGYSYEPDSNSTMRLQRVLIEGNYFSTEASSRLIAFANVRDRHDVRIVRNTFRHRSSKWFDGAYGQAWTGDPPVLGSGGPIQGIEIRENVIGRNGPYGVTGPQGSHCGSGLGTFVNADLEVSGNVIGDYIGASPACSMNTQLANFNRHVNGGALNVRVPYQELEAALPVDACGEWRVPVVQEDGTVRMMPSGKGADCEALAPVFALLQYLPEA